jgi:hypothetical protein
MEIMEIFAEGEEGEDSSIGDGDTFVQDEISNSRSLSYDKVEIAVRKTGALG